MIEKLERALVTLASKPRRRLVSPGTVTVQASPGWRAQKEQVKVQRGDHAEKEAVSDRRPAQLCSNPKPSRVLWDEHVNGTGGNKPAKDFTSEERGRVESK